MSSIFAPTARRVIASTATSMRASPMASTSAYTLSGWVSTTARQQQPSVVSSARRFISSTSQRDALSSEEPAAAVEPLAAATATTTAPVGSARPTTHYRITLRRSAIGLPSRVERAVRALGLKKRLQTVYHRHSPTVAGTILALKEIVHVDNVRRLDPPVGRLTGLDAADLESQLADWHEVTPDHEAIWVDANGDVVDWGAEAKKAPRGYRVVGNLVSHERDAAIRAAAEQDA